MRVVSYRIEIKPHINPSEVRKAIDNANDELLERARKYININVNPKVKRKKVRCIKMDHETYLKTINLAIKLNTSVSNTIRCIILALQEKN